MTIRLRPALLLLVLFVGTEFLAGCVMSRNPVTGRRRAYGYTWQQEIQIGREADADIIAQYGIYDDPDMTRYVDSLGQFILGYSHLQRPDADDEFRQTEFYFRVLDSPVVNAFALPGGYVYVTRGLMTHMENEAQLAVVLGHEIGHVAARHASKRAASQTFGQLGLIGAAIGGQAIFGGETAQSVLELGSTAAQLLFLSYGRDDERESDRLGVEYASLSGYAAGEGSAFFTTLKRLGEQSGQNIPGFLSTHPDPGEREQTILELAAEWSLTTTATRIGRDELLAQVDGIVAGDNPRHGFVRDGVFYHPDMAFEFPVPPGFQTINQASRVVMLTEDQRAVVLFTFVSGAASAEEAAQTFTQQEGLTVVQSGIGSANGLAARFVVVDAANSDGSVLRMRGHFVEFAGQVFRFLGLAAQAEYATYEPGFVRTMQGFARLDDPSVLAIEPARVALVRPSQDTVFRTLVPSTMPVPFSADGLAIINQLSLDSLVPSGRSVKLIR